MEPVDIGALKALAPRGVWVRIPPRALAGRATYSTSGSCSPGQVPVAFANAERDLWSSAARVPLKMAPSSAAATTTFAIEASRCVGFGGSRSSTIPQACSNSFLAMKPLTKPPVILNGMNRIFTRGRTVPDGPTDLPRRSWKDILKRTVKEFQEDNLTDWAAALTYYGVMSLFPMLLVLVALLGLIGQESTIATTTDSLRSAGLGDVAKNVQGPLDEIVRHKGGAGALVGFGLLGALWSASGWVGAFTRAMNSIYDVKEGRPFWKLRPLQVVITLVTVLLVSLVLLAVVVSGPIAKAVGTALGVGDTAVTVWGIAKWPVLLVVLMAMVAGLYYVAPNVRQPRLRWVTPGGVVAVVTWIVASAGFGIYVSNFSSYGKTYGTLGSVITFLVWMWLSNLALLFGGELDSELERERELKLGLPAEEELRLRPRQAPGGG